MDIENEVKIIDDFVTKGNFHAAMNIAISALNDCRREDNQTGVDIFIEVINKIAQSISDKFGNHRK